MTLQEVLAILARMEGQLVGVEDQARATREMARHTLERLGRLREDLQQARRLVLAQPGPDPSPPSGPAAP
jgi:hypothetical protein